MCEKYVSEHNIQKYQWQLVSPGCGGVAYGQGGHVGGANKVTSVGPRRQHQWGHVVLSPSIPLPCKYVDTKTLELYKYFLPNQTEKCLTLV